MDVETPTTDQNGRKKLTWTRRPVSAIAERVQMAKNKCKIQLDQKINSARQKSTLPPVSDHKRNNYKNQQEKQNLLHIQEKGVHIHENDNESCKDLPRFMQATCCHKFKSARLDSDNDSDLSFDADILDDKVNIDQGIAINDYKPSQLLDKKIQLICQIKESRIKYLRELYQVQQYRHMLKRAESDRKQEIIIIHELDPYFNFQDKIKSTLTDIGAGKQQRQKIQDQKIKQLRNQLLEKQNFMQQDLREKCKELAVLQRQNKKRNKGKSPKDRDNFSDSQSVSGSTSYQKSKANKDTSRIDDNKSTYTPQTRKKDIINNDHNSQKNDGTKIINQAQSNNNELKNNIDEDKHPIVDNSYDINLNNIVWLHNLIQSCNIMKKMYFCHKQIETGQNDEQCSLQTIEDI